MMINLIWDDGFARKLKKVIKHQPELLSQFKQRFALLAEDPYNSSLRTHKLSGKLKGTYSCSLDYNYRLLFEMIDNQNLLLIDIGTHVEVY